MSKGLLGKALTVAGQFVTVATISSTADFATITIDFENINMDGTAADSNVDVYLASGSADPTAIDKVGHAIIKAAGGHYVIDCGLASPGERVIVLCDTVDLAVRVTGLETIPVVTA